MGNYVKHLEGQYSKATFKRKMDYIDYNFGRIVKNLAPKKCRILEIGPGMGEGVKYLKDNGFRNIDIVDNDNNVLSGVADRFGVDKKYCVDDLITLKGKLGKYDLIILVQALEHIPLNQQAKVVSMLYSCLRKMGTMLIVVPNAGNPLGMVERYGDLQHTNSFTEQSLRDLARVSGIKTARIEIKGYEIPPYNFVNLIRIFFQKILHMILYGVMIINGGTYFKIMTPNISLIIKKN